MTRLPVNLRFGQTQPDAMRPRVLLLGCKGQLGAELARQFRDTAMVPLDRHAADLSRPETLRAVVRSVQPDLILNAAAYTAVDRAESEPELAGRINHLAPGVLAEEAERIGALLVHYSTDYVFDGSKPTPWVETDEPAPLSVYGATKLAGEQAVAAACSRHLILRTSWVYAAHGHNFLRTMLRLGRERDLLRVVDDQHGAPTSAAALAEATRAVVEHLSQDETILNKTGSGASAAPEAWAGIYHATCAGQTTWYGFARAVFAEAALHEPRVWPDVQPIAGSDYPTPARRPRNSVLSNRKLAARFQFALPPWHEAMRSVFSTLARARHEQAEMQ